MPAGITNRFSRHYQPRDPGSDSSQEISDSSASSTRVNSSYTSASPSSTVNKQSESTPLPVLIKERMWHELCNAHVQLAHAGVSNTYNKLKIKWGNVKQDLVAKFISKLYCFFL